MKHVEFGIVAVIATVALMSCSRNSSGIRAEKPSATADLSYNQAIFGRDIDLTISNNGKRPICFPRTAIAPTSPNFMVRQNGAAVPPQREVNRESVSINGVDVAEGLAVIPAGKKRNFFINVDGFALSANRFTASIRLDVFDCVGVFSVPHPLRQTLQASVMGSLPPR